MVKSLFGMAIIACIVYTAGLFPHVAVGLTAIAIVFIFKMGNWLE